MTDARIDLPPYSGQTPTCPKCGHQGASTEYRAWGVCHHDSGPDIVLGMQHNERLHRECGNCSFAWDEATTEQKSPVIKEET